MLHSTVEACRHKRGFFACIVKRIPCNSLAGPRNRRQGLVVFARCRIQILLLGLLIFLCTCTENLPTRENPNALLRVTSFVANQGVSKSDRFKIAMRVTIQNLYEETLEDTVNLEGAFVCWWKKHPEIANHYHPGNEHIKPVGKLRDGILKLDPGESIFIDYYWYFYTDENEDILDLLDYTQNDIRNGFMYALPEIFVLEAELTLFSHLPPLTAGPIELEVTGWRAVVEN